MCYVQGVTLFLDFPFPAYPDNLGHWAELLLPLFSVTSSTRLPQLLQGGYSHIDRLVLLNVRPELLYSWPKEMLGLALDPARPPWPPPQSPLSTEGSSSGSNSGGSSGGSGSSGGGGSAWHTTLPWERPLPPVHGTTSFEGWCAHSWMVFENVVMVQDR